jgi:hypothetical protein
MGDNSVVMVKRPSKGRSGKGVVTSAVMWVWILEGLVGCFVNAQCLSTGRRYRDERKVWREPRRRTKLPCLP